MCCSKGGIAATARISTTAHTLTRRFYVINSLRRNNQMAVAAASLLVALKLHNSPNPIQFVANVFASTCYERLNKTQRSRELLDGFKHLKNRGMDKTWFHSTWKNLVDDLTAAMRLAERKLLCSTGFANLPDMGWDWEMLSKIEKQLQLRSQAKWMSSGSQDELSIDPLSTVNCIVDSDPKNSSGRQIAQQFLINSARLSPAHCRFTATVIALTAIKTACETKGIKLPKPGDPANSRPFGIDVVGAQHNRCQVPENISEDDMAGCLVCVERARKDLHKLLVKLKGDTKYPSSTFPTGHAMMSEPRLRPEPGGKQEPHPKSEQDVLPDPPLPGPPGSRETSKREREDLEEGECVAWGDEDVGDPAAKKSREDVWQPPSMDQPVDDAWRPQAPPPPPSRPDTPPSAELRAAGVLVSGDGGRGVGQQVVEEIGLQNRLDVQGMPKPDDVTKVSKFTPPLSGDESLEEGEMR